MSVMGQEQLSGPLKTSSALPFKADLDVSSAIGRFVPNSEACDATHRWVELCCEWWPGPGAAMLVKVLS